MMTDFVWLYPLCMLGGIFFFTTKFFYDQTKAPYFSFFYVASFFIYHTLFMFYYIAYFDGISDSFVYFDKAHTDSAFSLESGTKFIVSITAIFARMGFSINGIFFVFSLIGFVGILLTIAAIKDKFNIICGSRLYYLTLAIFFLPLVHIWTVLIGKDPLMIFAIGLVFYTITRKNLNIVALLFALLLIWVVRPHMISVALASVCFAFVFSSRFAFWPTKVAIGVMVSFFLAYFAQQLDFSIVGLGDSVTTSQELIEWIENRQNIYADTASGFSLSDSNAFERMFTFLFLPMFNDIRAPIYLLASLENAILLGLTVAAFRLKLIKQILASKDFSIYVACLFFIIGAAVLSHVAGGNYGLTMRQKVMVYPSWMFIVIFALSKRPYFQEKYYSVKVAKNESNSY